MMKLIIIYLPLLLNAQPSKQISICEKVQAIIIYNGYAVTDHDSTFNYNEKQYLIKVRETYKSNRLESAQIWKSEGYIKYSKDDFLKDKSLILDYNLNAVVQAELPNNKYVKINNERFIIKAIDKKRRIVYCVNRREKELIYRLTYQ